jgi:hypothetical protein
MMSSQIHPGNHPVEACLRKALHPLGEGWDLDVIEAMIDHYNVNFSEDTEQTISGIESALREILGNAADLFIERFYDELGEAGRRY